MLICELADELLEHVELPAFNTRGQHVEEMARTELADSLWRGDVDFLHRSARQFFDTTQTVVLARSEERQ